MRRKTSTGRAAVCGSNTAVRLKQIRTFTIIHKEKYHKKELIRVVRDNTGKVTVDKTGKQNGRGAYLKKDLEVVDMARKTKALEKYLEVLIPEEVYEELEKAINK